MRAYPYERVTGVVDLRVTGIELSGPGEVRERLDTSAFSVTDKVVALGGLDRDDWERARLALTVSVPGRATEDDAPWSDVSVVVVLTEGATNTRLTSSLTRESEDGRLWGGRIELWRADHVDRASMTAHVVATVGGVAGRVVASTDRDWVVDVKSDAPLRDRRLDFTEVGFAEGPEWLRPFKDMPWAVDTSGDLPVVRLNADFEGISELVHGEASGPEGLVRELLIAQMCTDVWTAVFHAAVGDLEVEEDGTPLFPLDWRGEVLREMLQDVVPGRPAEDALSEVHRRRAGTAGWTDLQPRIHYAASRRAEVPKALTATVQGLNRLDRGVDA